jgi:hypothetical protein
VWRSGRVFLSIYASLSLSLSLGILNLRPYTDNIPISVVDPST